MWSFFSSFLIKLTGLLLVNNTIWVSNAHFYDTGPVCVLHCMPATQLLNEEMLKTYEGKIIDKKLGNFSFRYLIKCHFSEICDICGICQHFYI